MNSSMCMLSHFSRVRLFATPWTGAYQASLSMGFSRKEYWSGLPFPSPMNSRPLNNSGARGANPALIGKSASKLQSARHTHCSPYLYSLFFSSHSSSSADGVEGRNRTGSILKAGLHLGLDCGLWAICPVSMETSYQLENQAPRRKSPKALLRLKEHPNYLCNRIESYILLCYWGMATGLLIIAHC